MRGKPHPPDVRAMVEARLLAGWSQARICEDMGLPNQTVSDIATHSTIDLGMVRDQRRVDYGQLVLAYFEAVLHSMTSQAVMFGEPDYFRSQSANDNAIAHGVMGDKLAGIAHTAEALGLLGSQTTGDYSQLPEPDSD